MNNEEKLKSALSNLVNKLELTIQPMLDVCLHSQIHGVPYKGPNWADEVAEAKKLLEELK